MKKKLTTAIVSSTALFSLFSTTAWGAAYQVQPNDSLWKIAEWNNITVESLKRSNGLSGDTVMTGQVLQVPWPYRVQANETMWTISRKFGVTLEALIKVNPQIKNPNYIWAGSVINVPSGNTPTQVKGAAMPSQLADGFFPLAKGTYKPYTNNYADERFWNESGNSYRKHEGQDIFADKGTPVYSAMAGEVINYGWNEMGGWRLTVRVDNSTVFYYAHLSAYAPGMGKGAKVKKGQLIGYVGSTGYGPEGTEGKFEPHLHFSIYKTYTSDWTSIDPNKYLRWWEANR